MVILVKLETVVAQLAWSYCSIKSLYNFFFCKIYLHYKQLDKTNSVLKLISNWICFPLIKKLVALFYYLQIHHNLNI